MNTTRSLGTIARHALRLPRNVLASLWALAALTSAAPTLHAANWPAQNVRIVVPYPPGGLTDVVTRIIAEGLQRTSGKTVLVENKPGAAGQIGLQAVIQAPRDGHTLALVVPATMVTLPLTNPNYKIRPLQDFEPITAGVDTFLTLVTSPASGVRSIQDLRAFAQKSPDRMMYGTPGVGSSYHLNTVAMLNQLKLDALHVPYKGESEVLNQLAGGHLSFSLVSSAARSLIEGGKLVALATAADTRPAVFAQLPTFREQGIDFKTDGWVGYAVAQGTPAALADQVNAGMVRAINDPAVRDKLSGMGFIVVGNSRAAFTQSIRDGTAKYEALIRSGAVKLK
jgi:tripartite-type tricarboxylate transporter receptor subunit TctC